MSLGSENFNDIRIYRQYTVEILFSGQLDGVRSINLNGQQLECDKSDIKIGQWMLLNFYGLYTKMYQDQNGAEQEQDNTDCMEEPLKEEETKAEFKPLDVFFSVYSVVEDMFVYMGKYDYHVGLINFKLNELENDIIHIKCRKYIHQDIVDDYIIRKTKICRIMKERKISTIIIKVDEWRQLYKHGKVLADGILKKYSLEEAAQEVGISKKSLDDYLLQLRFAREHGFDFNANKDSKVGVLRKFVKEIKKMPQANPGKVFEIYRPKEKE